MCTSSCVYRGHTTASNIISWASFTFFIETGSLICPMLTD